MADDRLWLRAFCLQAFNTDLRKDFKIDTVQIAFRLGDKHQEFLKWLGSTSALCFQVSIEGFHNLVKFLVLGFSLMHLVEILGLRSSSTLSLVRYAFRCSVHGDRFCPIILCTLRSLPAMGQEW